MTSPNEAHATAIRAGYLPMWVIYERPADYPQGFIARMHVIGEACGPTITAIKGEKLQDVRAKLPAGVVCIGREDGDEPQIVEVWI